MKVKIEVVRVIDKSYPVFVEARLTDCNGNAHCFHDKLPVFTLNETMQNFLTNYYNNVMEDANAPTLDLGELRKKIGSIKGVGEKRLDEIMAAIEKHFGI